MDQVYLITVWYILPNGGMDGKGGPDFVKK